MLILFNIFSGLEEAIFRLFLIIDAKIYWVFSQLYDLYIDLASARIFNNNIFDIVIGNVYAIITVIALFIVAFMLLKSMVNVDESSKGTKTIKDLIIRIVKATFLICLSPFLFDLLFDVQSSILGYGSIQKMILGTFGADYSTIETVPKKVVELNEDGSIKYDNEGNVIPIQIPQKCEDNPYSEDDECTDIMWCSKQDEATKLSYGCKDFVIYEKVDTVAAELIFRGNVMAFYVINGFMHPADNYDINTVVVDASKEFGVETGTTWAFWGAIIGGFACMAIGILGTAFTGGWSNVITLAGFKGMASAFALGGAIGGGSGLIANDVAASITASEYKWSEAIQLIIYGDFNQIVPFAEAIIDGEMNYIPIISTIGAGFLAYMMFSFCLDLGVRAAKLLFYETMAPVSFLLSIIPGKEDLTNNWFKAVFTTWLEVFVRIFIISITVLLISNLEFDALNQFSPIASAILILGIITFAKQIPKALGEITGIKSEGIKLGIKEKLMDGGAGALLTAGAAVGGGLTAGLRNSVNAWKNTEGGAWRKLGGALKSGVAGTASGAVRAGKAGWNAKSFKDMKGAASKGAVDATTKRDRRAAYKASHGGTFMGAMSGHIEDALYGVGRFAGFNNIDSLVAQNQLIGDIQSKRKAIDSEAFDVIDGDLAKGKLDSIYSKFVYDKSTGRYKLNAFAEKLGIQHSMYELRALESKLAAAKSSGDAKEIQQAQLQYSQYRNDWADELRNISLLGQSSWAELENTAEGKEMMADLSKLRMAADSYRETLKSNSNASYISSLTGAEDILDKEKALNMKHAALKDIKNEMKIEQTKITKKINEVRKKDSETKNK